MIYGIGIDIVEVARMEASYARFGERLARRILTPEEFGDFGRTRRPVRFLSMRFAVKEAASKAFGTGFREGISPGRIGVRHDRRGKPSLVFLGEAARRARREGIAATFVSMTDERAYAVAYVIFERADTGAAPARNQRRRFRA